MDGLTEGRIVHYVLPGDYAKPGEHRPAIIVKVWNKETGSVNLQVFMDGTNDNLYDGRLAIWTTSVVYSEEPKPGTWHWPERA